MKTRRTLLYASAAVCIFIIGMTFTEQMLAPPYWLKSLIKAAMILLILGGGCAVSGKNLRELTGFAPLYPEKRLIIPALCVIPAVLLGFWLLRGQLDLPAIRQNLMQKEQLTKANCLFVFAYIAAVNSLLEEALFRGMLFQAFADSGKQRSGWIFAPLAFAVYHIGIVDSWLSLPMLLLCILLLWGAGAFLQWICVRFASLQASWLVHACANLAINAVGILLIFFCEP